ncbi:MAG: glycosyltransferase, partial [Acidimicrobiia bacterium]|nr:glycosyltransferase [Acidimicrobiia bacterium]
MGIGIAAAGSGGHVYPAIAVADALVEAGVPKDDIVFFGGTRMESTAVPEAGYRLVSVNIHGIRRSLSLDNLRLPAKVRAASKTIADEIRNASIDAMVVFGGYVSGPAALAARKVGIPLVVHEANAVPGMANKMIAGRADLVLVAFDQAASRLGGEVVGNPLRSSFSDFDRNRRRTPARKRFGLDPDGCVLAVVGGSLGASALNAIASAIAAD